MAANGVRAPWADWDEDYRAFQEAEGLPVHTGIAVDDVRELEVDEWERTGGRGAFINLFGMEGTCDLQLFEIPPGTELKPQRHLHDALVLVLDGSGFTTIGEGGLQTSFEWNQHSAFLIPQNTRYVHANASEDEPVRLLVETPLPLLYSLLREDSVIWENDSYDQWAEIASDDFFTNDSELIQGVGKDTRTYWTSNFIPDTSSFAELAGWSDRGGGGSSVFFPLRSSSMWSHISEFQVGQYKKAHRHICGANVLLLSGEGYSLLWQEGDEERMRVDWSPYSLFVPPTLWYHQQFNTSTGPARYLVFHSPIKGIGITGSDNEALAPLTFGNQIEYHEEDPAIREAFVAELEEKGIEFQMAPDIYEKDMGEHVLWGGKEPVDEPSSD